MNGAADKILKALGGERFIRSRLVRNLNTLENGVCFKIPSVAAPCAGATVNHVTIRSAGEGYTMKFKHVHGEGVGFKAWLVSEVEGVAGEDLRSVFERETGPWAKEVA